MLSNKDFTKFLSEGSSKKDSARFDLNQIRQWDNQIHAKFKNKNKNDKRNDEGTDEITSKSKQDTSIAGYRDRAKERRDDANPDYDPKLENLTNINVENSKFLGGDLEHTYLVKGLDYAFLHKIKSMPNDTTETSTHDEKQTNQVGSVPKSSLAQGIHSFLIHKSSTSVSSALSKNMTALRISRTSYEYDLTRSDIFDIPTTIMTSKEVYC